jgi:hypothetical protein
MIMTDYVYLLYLCVWCARFGLPNKLEQDLNNLFPLIMKTQPYN